MTVTQFAWGKLRHYHGKTTTTYPQNTDVITTNEECLQDIEVTLKQNHDVPIRGQKLISVLYR